VAPPCRRRGDGCDGDTVGCSKLPSNGPAGPLTDGRLGEGTHSPVGEREVEGVLERCVKGGFRCAVHDPSPLSAGVHDHPAVPPFRAKVSLVTVR
jgi:hypothetical protein